MKEFKSKTLIGLEDFSDDKYSMYRLSQSEKGKAAALNKAIGGAAGSQHCSGEAIDIDMDGHAGGVTNKMVFDYIKENLNFDQLIWEFGTDANPDWVHVSYESTGKQRKQILKAVKKGGATSYVPYK